jgi:hypothetical protein
MEKVLTTNNGESNWSKLETFGLHARRGFIGFNRYIGKNSGVSLVDPLTGMRVLLIPASVPRTERAPKADKVPSRRGRPAQFGPVMFREPQKRGRKPLTEAQRAEREAIKVELKGLIFFGPVRKRGPKPMTEEQKAQKAAERASNGTVQATTGKKRGRISEADRIKTAKQGEVIQSKGGSWLMIADGLASWVAA